MHDVRMRALRSAAPYLRLFKGATFVLKVGGAVIDDPRALDGLADQAGLLHQLGIRVVLVHGGGPQATRLAERLGVPVERVDGRRVTSSETLEIAKMVFAGSLNTDVLAALGRHHVAAVGLSGVDAGLVRARRRPPVAVADGSSGATREVDYGHVGDVVAVDPGVVRHLLDGGYLPVVCSLAGGDDGAVLNVNADTIAARLAVGLGAAKLILLSGVTGVLADAADPASLISHMDGARLAEVLAAGARDGMRPKLEACRLALEGGVPRAHIVDGTADDSLLLEVFTNEGSGTLIELEASAEPESA